MLEVLDHQGHLVMANTHGCIELLGEDVEGSIIGIGFDVVSALEAPDNEPKAGLHILHAHGVSFLLKIGEGRLLEFDSLLVFHLDVLGDLLPVEIQVVVVEGVEEPIFHLIGGLDCDECQPVGCNCQHQVQDQGLIACVLLEFHEFVIQVYFAIEGSDQILVLELPGVADVIEVLMLPENLELLEPLHAYLIESPLKVPVEDVLLSPRPLVVLPRPPLVVQQEVLHLDLESPEGGTTLDIIVTSAPVEHLQETESVEDSMITTEIRGVLLEAFPLVHLVIFIVNVRDQLLQALTRNLNGFGRDVSKKGIEDRIDDFSSLFLDDSDLDFP